MNKLEIVINYQKANGYTNQAFADVIGYNRVSWIKIKTGRVPATVHFFNKVETILPDIFLTNEATIVPTSNPTRPLPLRARISRRLYRLIDKLLRKITERLIIEPDGRED